jgi:ATP-dependent Clp protease ATP-binding subunit ClpC
VELASRYITGRCLPDKAIDVIDESGARIRLKSMVRPPDLKEIEEEAERLNQQKEEAVANQDFEKAAALRDQADKLKKKKEQLTTEWREKSKENEGVVDEEVIAEVVAKMTGIPLTRLSSEDAVRLLQMEDEMHERVISQDEAIKQVSKAVRRSRSGLKDPKRPTGCFLFAGPTGVGKTLLAKTLAEFMFGDQEALIQIDMSEYMEKHNVSRLIGAPPGYVGFEEGGQLTEKIRRRPYAVVLMDEIEKAHPDVFNMMLQIMEEGHLTDSFGRMVDFKNVIMIMTTNAGAQAIAHGAGFGFGKKSEEADYGNMKKEVMSVLERDFKPEFLGRLDEVVVFKKLAGEDLKLIIDIELSKVRERLGERGLGIELNDAAKEFIIKAGGDLDYGARPLRRAVEQAIEDPLSEELLRGAFVGQNHILVTVKTVSDQERLGFEGVVKDVEEPVVEEVQEGVGAAAE